MTVVMEGCFGQNPEIAGVNSRAPRLKLKVPVVFQFAEGVARGLTLDISESGLLATFDRRMDVWITGQLRFLVGEQNINVEARVARVDWYKAALAFRSLSTKDRMILRSLIEESGVDAPQVMAPPTSSV